uniref:Sulf_transp domain-containing protein n=1 Tax=Mesocestoides corti TaxID=53468 RepID=A0A5K3FWY1_MESCO
MLVFTAGLLGLLAAWFENGRMLNTGCGLVLFHQINDHYLAAGIMSLLTCACQLGAVVCASLLSEMVASKVKS